MFHKRAVVCNGVRYNSLAEFKRKNNLSKWLRLDDIIKLDSVTIEKAYKVHDQQFDTLKEISDYAKLSIESFPLLDEFSTIIISSFSVMFIPFCFSNFN